MVVTSPWDMTVSVYHIEATKQARCLAQMLGIPSSKGTIADKTRQELHQLGQVRAGSKEPSREAAGLHTSGPEWLSWSLARHLS